MPPIPLGFITGTLAPRLQSRCQSTQTAQNQIREVPMCGRRSDKIKSRKDAQTRARTKVFARIGKMITMAAKNGGPDIIANKALADAIEIAKAASFPKDTMEKSIARATSADQADFKESSFEVYGHGGAAIYIDVLTDNPNRAAADIRTVVNKQKMKIGSPGSVAFNFDRMGVVRILEEHVNDPDELLMTAIDAGAQECDKDPSNPHQYVVTSDLVDFATVRSQIFSAGYRIESAGLEMIPKTLATISEKDTELNVRAIELLEDLDDVDAVFTSMAPSHVIDDE